MGFNKPITFDKRKGIEVDYQIGDFVRPGRELSTYKLKDFIKDYQIQDKSIYLQPLSQSKKATELCVQSCIDYNWKISIQIHKYIGLR